MQLKFASRCALALMTCLVAHAGAITVYVGYADNLRPSGFFPTPWLGDPGVVSETPTGESLDTGAIRIDNNTGAAITISNFTVTLGGGQVFAIWGTLVIPAGETGIFTQTSSYNFDTSEYGVFGDNPVNVDAAHPLGGCTNPANLSQTLGCQAYQPTVAFLLDGTPTSYKDTGHVLDTFGYDLINLLPPGGDGNESINWSTIGTLTTRSGDAPEPATALLIGPGLLLGATLLRRRRSVKASC